MIPIAARIRALLESVDIDPDTAVCPATTSNGQIRCGKRFDGHTAHLARDNGWDVVW